MSNFQLPDSLRFPQLTRVLRDAFGGNSQTAMIVTVSPNKSDKVLTQHAFNFARKTAGIQNRARVNYAKREAEDVGRAFDSEESDDDLLVGDEYWKSEEHPLVRAGPLTDPLEVALVSLYCMHGRPVFSNDTRRSGSATSLWIEGSGGH